MRRVLWILSIFLIIVVGVAAYLVISRQGSPTAVAPAKTEVVAPETVASSAPAAPAVAAPETDVEQAAPAETIDFLALFKNDLQTVVAARDIAQMALLMSDPFQFDDDGMTGFAAAPDAAAGFLAESIFTEDVTVTFSDTPPAGLDMGTVTAVAADATLLYGSNLGSNGNDMAIFTIVADGDSGNFSWQGLTYLSATASGEASLAETETAVANSSSEIVKVSLDQSESDTAANTESSTESSSETAVLQDDPVTHTVAQGEWLLQIARCYGTTAAKIQAENGHLFDHRHHYGHRIFPLETLTVPDVGSEGEAFGPPCIYWYTVQSGDTLYSLAQTYSTTIDMLVRANFGHYGYYGYYGHYYYGYHYYPYIYVGQKLIIPLNADNIGLIND